MRPSSAFSAVGCILLEWFWSSLKGRVVPNRCKVVLSDHLYAGMKPFYPEGSGLFPSQAARGCRWWKLCQEWHLIPSLEFQRLVQPMPRLAAHGGPAHYIFSLFCAQPPAPPPPLLLPLYSFISLPLCFLPSVLFYVPPFFFPCYLLIALFSFPPTFPPSTPVTVYNFSLLLHFHSSPFFLPPLPCTQFSPTRQTPYPFSGPWTLDAEISEHRDHLWTWKSLKDTI